MPAHPLGGAGILTGRTAAGVAVRS